VLAAVNAEGEFIWIKNNVPGGDGDAKAWNGSSLEERLKELHDRLPDIVLNLGTDEARIKPFAIADTAFALKPHCQKCVENLSLLDEAELAWHATLNQAMIRTRRCAPFRPFAVHRPPTYTQASMVTLHHALHMCAALPSKQVSQPALLQRW
jgi:hypothetical protein